MLFGSTLWNYVHFVSNLYLHTTLCTWNLFLDVLKLQRIGPKVAESLHVSGDTFPPPNNLEKNFHAHSKFERIFGEYSYSQKFWSWSFSLGGGVCRLAVLSKASPRLLSSSKFQASASRVLRPIGPSTVLSLTL